jgi:inner membrane protein
MINGLITERENIQNEAITEVSTKWADKQTIIGPIISIPYIKSVKEISSSETGDKVVHIKDYIYILPTDLKIKGNLNPEKRHRGIYEIVVYNSNLDIEGSFEEIDFSSLDIPIQNIQFNKAQLIVGIDDLRGIEKQISVDWNNQQIPFNAGVPASNIVKSGITAVLNLDSSSGSTYKFKLHVDLKGSQYLYFSPVGKVTDINLKSSWSNPSFSGAFLPDKRTVTDQGFTANWNVLHLNRNFPQMWVGNVHTIEGSSFGINLLLPIDSYQKTYRSIHYAILFIGFTFLVFFFLEVLNNVFIHPIQYILVGIALVIFYILLLSLSEHIHYDRAFILSSLATLMLIAAYVKAILKSKTLALLISGILVILYGFIFVIIQSQDYALLMGSIGLFLILALVMYFSRKIDWQNIQLNN